jgi:hypothetical protein
MPEDTPIDEYTRRELTSRLRALHTSIRRVAHFAHDEYQNSLEQDLYAMANTLEARIAKFVEDQTC